MAAEGKTSLAPPQGEAAHGTEGAPSELSLAAPQGLIPRREVHRDGSRTIRSGIASGVRIPDMFYFLFRGVSLMSTRLQSSRPRRTRAELARQTPLHAFSN